MTADPARLMELEAELDAMRHSIAPNVPEGKLWNPWQVAHDALAMAASGCERAANALRQAKEEKDADD